ncbi:hypothetical protein E6C27_scaffold21G003790 [Cucumis melo var. makuwa]|uniref:Uncharacterized protein n=1 Tax=Cucumis melo var. makuwa TaxID=1194695 RepID=A0A5A7VLY0_CUCMM|nr:hypothetical protein E6C27_scaffold21G003790 [Cucumis melo var. makuwa]
MFVLVIGLQASVEAVNPTRVSSFATQVVTIRPPPSGSHCRSAAFRHNRRSPPQDKPSTAQVAVKPQPSQPSLEPENPTRAPAPLSPREIDPISVSSPQPEPCPYPSTLSCAHAYAVVESQARRACPSRPAR